VWCIEDSDGRILGVVCFHSWEPWNRTIEVSAVSEDPRWMRARSAWHTMFAYAYEVCGADKIWSRTPASNERALRFLKAVGFQREAVLKRQFGDDDAVLSCRFKEDWVAASSRPIARDRAA
jgi:RimJ/RimL family protein N-acetyltransferase